jgi:ankyrin repeat protein
MVKTKPILIQLYDFFLMDKLKNFDQCIYDNKKWLKANFRYVNRIIKAIDVPFLGSETLLHLLAARDKSGKFIDILLQAGASHGVFDERQKLPIHCAAENLNFTALQILLNGLPSNIFSQDRDEKHPLHYALQALMLLWNQFDEDTKNLEQGVQCVN